MSKRRKRKTKSPEELKRRRQAIFQDALEKGDEVALRLSLLAKQRAAQPSEVKQSATAIGFGGVDEWREQN